MPLAAKFLRGDAPYPLRAHVFVRMVAFMTEHRYEAGALAAVVVALRCDAGMTQAGLAEKAGIGHRTVQNIEAGKRPQSLILARLARALGMTSAELRQAAAAESAGPEAKAS